MSTSKKKELLIFGYIRLYENTQLKRTKYNSRNTSSIIPKPISNLVLQYFSSFEWKYKLGNDEDFVITDDGLSVTLKQDKYGTIMFGEYLNVNDRVICTLHIKLAHDSRLTSSGFGFITNKFADYHSKDYNPGFNHSTTVNLSGYFKKCNDFSCSYAHRQWISHLKKWAAPMDIMAIQINTIEKIGRIWNYSQEESYLKSEKVFEVEFDVEEVGFVVYGGNLKFTMTVVDQIYEYPANK